ncbi:IRK-interacting protein isoform X2 [Cryptomeria japonica]|uniref:IRK-interacting protein isoform X2 n=1 Tax=Cryptomeria japonica TaxID=3369 RepID=UPI0027D9E978|nr:IRK-interacting protein isoform X2 [Cryptomeria japonica]
MANCKDLRSISNAPVQCKSPAKIKPPSSSTCEEVSPQPQGEKIQPKKMTSVMWEELEQEIEKESPTIPTRSQPGLLSRRVNSVSSMRSSMDHSPSCSQNPYQHHHQHTPLHPGRGNPVHHVMSSNIGVSCNRCRPAFKNKESPAVIPLPELQDMIGLPSKNPNNNGNGLLKSWFFSRTKKIPPKKLISTDTDKAEAHSLSPAIMSIEGLKQKLVQANIGRDVAISEVAQLRSSMVELEKKLRELELHCHDLKHAFDQTAQEGGVARPKRPVLESGTKALNSVHVSYETKVKCFLQVVSEARVTVRQLSRNLIISIHDNDCKGLEKLTSLLQPFDVHVGPRITKVVMYHLEALLNQAFYEDFESCNFQKNGAQMVLDTYESCAMNYRSFNELRNLSWDEVLNKGTRFFSEDFSRFCDQKMGLIVSMLNWASAWPEHLLQAFFTAAKYVWLVHLAAFSFQPPLVIFRVERSTKFDSVYMEDIVADRQTKQAAATVRIMLMPGFYVHNSVIKCKVLCRYI